MKYLKSINNFQSHLPYGARQKAFAEKFIFIKKTHTAQKLCKVAPQGVRSNKFKLRVNVGWRVAKK